MTDIVPSSAENAVLLLAALHERGRLRVRDAADLLSVTPPTAHRLLSTLKRHQFAEQDRQRAYLPGPRLRSLDQSGPSPASELRAAAGPVLAELSGQTGETVHLVGLEGNGARFLDGHESPHALRVGRRVGLLLAAHTTSGGKALLAQLPDDKLLALYPDRLVRLRDGSARSLTVLRRELITVRRQRFALNLEASERGVNAVGHLICDASGRPAGALAVAAPSVRSDRRSLLAMVPNLQAACTRIGEALH